MYNQMSELFEAARQAGITFSREFEVERKRIHTGELTLHFLDWGNRDAPIILLLHGIAQTAHSWDFIAIGLADYYHVVAIDARGHGDSDWSKTSDYSPAAHQRDLDHIVRQLAPNGVCVIGLSMGGRSAYTFAARRPDRVQSVVVVDAGPVSAAAGRQRIRSFMQLGDTHDTYDSFVKAVQDYQPHRSIDQIRATLKNNLRRTPDGKWTWKYDRAIRDPSLRRPTPMPEVEWNLLKSIRSPALVVRGSRSDVLAREVAIEMSRVMPQCSFVEIPNSGHIVTSDNPSGFLSAVLPWLEKTFPGRKLT